jgi:hypothetical protein
VQEPDVAIIIPHFQTKVLAQLSLRSIRLHTPVPRNPSHEVIVVDNGSRDGESLDYLRRVEWIRLIERSEGIADQVGRMHKEALDIGMAASRSKYVLAFHTDTVPIRDDWLAWLVEQLERDAHVAAVGTYKLELKGRSQRLLKRLEESLPWWSPAGDAGDHRPWIRSHCALYRRAVLEELDLSFNDDADQTAGLSVQEGIEAAGYRAVLLPVPEMMKRVVHLNHGTMILRPELGARRRTIRRGLTRIERFLLRPEIQRLLDNDSLDHAFPSDAVQPHRGTAGVSE